MVEERRVTKNRKDMDRSRASTLVDANPFYTEGEQDGGNEGYSGRTK